MSNIVNLHGGQTSIKAAEPVPPIVELLEKPANPVVLEPAEVRTRVLTGLADEARRMLDEGVVAGAEDLDLAMITGAGFSFWNGGLTMLLEREGLGKFH